MARYIDADKLFEYYEERHKHLCEQNGETDAYCQGYEDAMYVAEHLDFTADVVPKSEVERLEKEVDRLSQVVLYHDAFKADEIKDAKAEVAREIFEEIESLAKIYTYPVVKKRNCRNRKSAVLVHRSERPC